VGTGFHPELTGRENIYISGAVLGMTKKEIDRKIEDIIEFSEVREFIDTPVKRYSSGMYVKLAFSVAAHLDSEIMIMDEVLAVGDMAFQKKCVDKMRLVSDKQQRTVLYVSHNMGTIRDLCDRVIVLDKGRVIFDGDAEKGIALYMSAVAGAQKTEVDLSVMPRHHLTDYKMKLLKVALVGKDEAVVTRGEKLTVKTDWLAEEDRAAVRLIVAVRSALDNVAVASMMSAPLCDVKAGGRYTATIAADTTPLVAGSYFFNLLLVQASGEGGVVVLDFVARCVSLEVVEKNKDDLAADREYRALGHIRLPEPETLCAEEIFKGEEKL
ncbi:MAG: Wzt carbohydrate-binding domain-containing protein, partial [Clostridia bacterium]|nr:Wzt carbohydrate-binding domain-containing protein [Clostridia bacterium]